MHVSVCMYERVCVTECERVSVAVAEKVFFLFIRTVV